MHLFKSICILALAAVTLVSCASPTTPTPPKVVTPQHPLVAFGDSVTEGWGATAPSHSYIARLSAALGPIDNRAIGSSRMEQQVNNFPSAPTDGDVIWLTGLNDMRWGTDLTALRATLIRGLDRLQSTPRTVYLGTCLPMTPLGYTLGDPYWNHGSPEGVQAVEQMFREVVAQRQGVYLVTFPNYNPVTMGAPDNVHPNDTGHEVLADAFLRAMQQTHAATH